MPSYGADDPRLQLSCSVNSETFGVWSCNVIYEVGSCLAVIVSMGAARSGGIRAGKLSCRSQHACRTTSFYTNMTGTVGPCLCQVCSPRPSPDEQHGSKRRCLGIRGSSQQQWRQQQSEHDHARSSVTPSLSSRTTLREDQNRSVWSSPLPCLSAPCFS